MIVDNDYEDRLFIKDVHSFKSGLYRVKRNESDTTSGPISSPTTLQSTLGDGLVKNPENVESSEINVNTSNNESGEKDKFMPKEDVRESQNDSRESNNITSKTISGASDNETVSNEISNKQQNVGLNITSKNVNGTSPGPLPQSPVSGEANMSAAPTAESPNKSTGTPVKKPSAATDNGLKKSFTDGEKIGEHLIKHKDEPALDQENTEVSDANSSMPSSVSTTVTTKTDGLITSSVAESDVTTVTSAMPSTHDNLMLTVANKTVSDSSERGSTEKAMQPELPLTTSAPESPGAVVSPKTVVVLHVTPNSTVTVPQLTQGTKSTGSITTFSATSTKTNTVKQTPPVVQTTTKAQTTVELTTTESPTTTEKTTTSTSTTVTTTTTPTRSTTQLPKTTNSQAPQTTVKRMPTTTNATGRQSVTQETVSPSDNSSLSVFTTKFSSSTYSTTASPGPSQVTQMSTKPSTAKDSFLSNAIQVIKNISRIQFAYLIIGIVLFINAVIFLVLYCKDKGRLAAPSDASDFLTAKNLGNCYRSMLTALVGLFLLCYMGLEVTYGALITSFVVDFLHWPTAQGATVAAIFWGSLATGRGFSIFIARGCGPLVMLSIDLVLMVVGGLCLAIGLYFYAKLVWLGTLILGLGMSSVFPASLFWAENHLHLTGKTTAVFTLGSGLGQIIFPTVTGYLFEHYEKMILMQITAGTSVFLLVLFVVIQCFASSSTDKVYVRDRNGFLPLEDEEEENVELDLIHFDKSETRRRRDKRARGETEYKTLISDLDDD